MTLPYKTVRGYLRKSVSDAIAQARRSWNKDQRQRTERWFFWHPDVDRAPYVVALTSNSMVVPALQWTIPTKPATRSDVLLAQDARKNDYKVPLLPGVMALSQAGVGVGGPAGYQAHQAPAMPAVAAMPAAVPSAAVAVPPAGAPGSIGPSVAGLQAQIVALQAQNKALETRMKTVKDLEKWPYNFWPEPPWDHDPAIEQLGNVPEEADAEAEKIAFMNSHACEPEVYRGNWRGARWLGRGSYGKCGLWVRVDRDNTIIDRMAIKESKVHKADWYRPKNWRNKTIREIRIHELIERHRIAPTDGHQHLVRYRGSRIFMTHRRYRLYLDLYEQGDLYHKMGWNERRSTRPAPALPEPYIWFVFKALVDACLVLQQGRSDKPINGWRPITHLDIKPDNIFLARFQGERWLVPVLADLGLSFYNLADPRVGNANTRDNPNEYQFPYDPRYPPETSEGGTKIIDEKADVWLIGHVLWNLVTHDITSGGPFRDLYDPHDGTRVQISQPGSSDTILSDDQSMEPMKFGRSDDLKTRIRTCLEYDPDDRPTLQQLQTSIEGIYRDPENHKMLHFREELGFDLSNPFEPFTNGHRFRQPDRF